MELKPFGQRLKELRLSRGLSVAQCAASIGRCARQWRQYEDGSAEPRRSTIDLIAFALDATPEELYHLIIGVPYAEKESYYRENGVWTAE